MRVTKHAIASQQQQSDQGAQDGLTEIGTINTASALDIELLSEASRAGRLDQGINALPQLISLDQATAEPVLLHRRIENSSACQS